MKWDKFRRSENVEDFTDPAKPVRVFDIAASAFMTLAEMMKLRKSTIAHDAGADDVDKGKA